MRIRTEGVAAAWRRATDIGTSDDGPSYNEDGTVPEGDNRYSLYLQIYKICHVVAA